MFKLDFKNLPGNQIVNVKLVASVCAVKVDNFWRLEGFDSKKLTQQSATAPSFEEQSGRSLFLALVVRCLHNSGSFRSKNDDVRCCVHL